MRSRLGSGFFAGLEFAYGLALVGGRRGARLVNGRRCRSVVRRLHGLRGECCGVMSALCVGERIGILAAVTVAVTAN